MSRLADLRATLERGHRVEWMGDRPDCDFCAQAGRVESAHYDGKTRLGPWAAMCGSHFAEYSAGRTGTGVAQRIVIADDSLLTDDGELHDNPQCE